MSEVHRVMVAALWEEAKGKLRAMVSVAGATGSTDSDGDKYEQLRTQVEAFIAAFEGEELHSL